MVSVCTKALHMLTCYISSVTQDMACAKTHSHTALPYSILYFTCAGVPIPT